MLQKTCRDFVEAELKPIAAQLDRENKFPTEQVGFRFLRLSILMILSNLKNVTIVCV